MQSVSLLRHDLNFVSLFQKILSQASLNPPKALTLPSNQQILGTMRSTILLITILIFATSCTKEPEYPKLKKYTDFTLQTDLSHLSENQKEMLRILIEASTIMDELFWIQAFGDKESFLETIDNPGVRKFAEINYGPWDRLDGNEPFIYGIRQKPKGANFYPDDMSKEEFEALEDERKDDLYTLIRRDSQDKLYVIPYHEYFEPQLQEASRLLKDAARLAEDEGFKNYLNLRAAALISDNYQPSDFAWMDNKSNMIELVYGPIETYEDQLFGYKAAYESYVLIKDMDWSERLAKYADMLPALQKELPVDRKYKSEKPGTDSDLNAYDVIYYAGDCNAGSKTIAINLPNDEEVQLEKGTRRLQLKNAMKAKFDKILVPISEVLIAEEQREFITFDAFFNNTMFHEVAHGLGIKNTINGNGTVREALKEEASALEEGKADVLGLYMVTKLIENGDLEGSLEEHYVTFMASIFRSVRFGASSAHGRANMLRFNYFMEQGAFSQNPDSGTYKVDFEKMKLAMNSLSELILTLQGDGAYEKVKDLMKTKGRVKAGLQSDLAKLAAAEIPVDIVFNQGIEVLEWNTESED